MIFARVSLPTCWLAAATFLVACEGASGDTRGEIATTTQDSIATDREIKASLAGEVAPGAQTYSYRGLYAGMTRSSLESHARAVARPDSTCRPSADKPELLACNYEVVLGPDSAHVSLVVVYGKANAAGDMVARTITATRELPLDVDGVRLAHRLSDAFEAQTALLDRRDATYGHHRAQVRMGTLNGARQNFADLAVEPKASRELLTVKLSRSGPSQVDVLPRRPPARTTKVRL